MKSRVFTISISVAILLFGVLFAWIFFTNQDYVQQELKRSSVLSKHTEQITTSTSQSIKNDVNELTGLPIKKDLLKSRPVAVMLNNIEEAQPLLGVSQADIVYECLVEGSITRIMGLFKSPYDINVIGSVRSAQPYFINLAKSMDAIYIHMGSSEKAFDMLNGGLLDAINLDADVDYMWRDSYRKENLGYEHSALTSGDLLEKAMNDKNIRNVYSNFTSVQKFGDSSQIKNGKSCTKMTVTFSWYKDTVFTYDKAKNTYLISQFGKSQVDGNTNTQNEKQNILALYVNTCSIDGSLLQELDLEGSGNGYYMNSGKVIPISWKRKTADSQFEFSDENGKALVMNPGQIYVCCVPLEGSIECS